MAFLDIPICFCFLLSPFGKHSEDVIFSQTFRDLSIVTPGQPMLVPLHL